MTIREYVEANLKPADWTDIYVADNEGEDVVGFEYQDWKPETHPNLMSLEFDEIGSCDEHFMTFITNEPEWRISYLYDLDENGKRTITLTKDQARLLYDVTAEYVNILETLLKHAENRKSTKNLIERLNTILAEINERR